MEEILAHRDDLSAWEAGARKRFAAGALENTHIFSRPGRSTFCWTWQIKALEDEPGLRDIVVRVWWRTPRRAVWVSNITLRTLLAVPTSSAARRSVALHTSEGTSPR